MKHENLTVALRSGADTNGRDLQLASDHPGCFPGNAFQHNATSSCTFQSKGIVHKLLDRLEGLALHFVSPHCMERLRSQPNVSYHWNLRVHQALHEPGPLFPAFDFHSLGTALFHKACCIAKRVPDADVK